MTSQRGRHFGLRLGVLMAEGHQQGQGRHTEAQIFKTFHLPGARRQESGHADSVDSTNEEVMTNQRWKDDG
jgi:hypothetical protein